MIQSAQSGYLDRTTSALIKEKLDIEYVAQMSSIEGISPADDVAQEYQFLKDEIERRESAYRSHCSQIRLSSAIHDWLLVIGKHNLSQLLPSLAGKCKPDCTSAALCLNPKNQYFREIVLRRKTSEGDALESALFVLGCAIPLVWIKEKFHDLSELSRSPADSELCYEAVQKVGNRAGKLKFVTTDTQGEVLVVKVLVTCE